MRSVADWLGEYGESHTHHTNKLLHWICVPVIVLSVMGLLRSLPVPGVVASAAPWFDWAVLAMALAVIYYLALSVSLAIGITLGFVAMYAVLDALEELPWPLWATSLVIFVVAWIGQFIGHAIEGKRPSFFKDVQFLLIGPLWLVAALFRSLRIRY